MRVASAAASAQPTSAANQVRQNAKWLIAAFAAVGAALAAGIQISNLGGVHGTVRLLGAFIGAALGLLGILVAIWNVGKVLDLQEATTSELAKSTALSGRLEQEPTFLGGFGHESVTKLVEDYGRTLAEVRVAQRATWKKPNDEIAAVHLKSLSAEFDALSQVVDFLRTVVIYDKTHAQYMKARSWVLAGAALAFIGLISFAYAANPPASAKKPEVTKVVVKLTSPPGPRGPQGPSGWHVEGS